MQCCDCGPAAGISWRAIFISPYVDAAPPDGAKKLPLTDESTTLRRFGGRMLRLLLGELGGVPTQSPSSSPCSASSSASASPNVAPIDDEVEDDTAERVAFAKPCGVENTGGTEAVADADDAVADADVERRTAGEHGGDIESSSSIEPPSSSPSSSSSSPSSSSPSNSDGGGESSGLRRHDLQHGGHARSSSAAALDEETFDADALEAPPLAPLVRAAAARVRLFISFARRMIFP
jgi:hypothetical protein